MIAAALDLAAHGFAVFPVWGFDVERRCACRSADCTSPGKHPPVRWRDVATRDAAEITRLWRRWPEASIGVATGAPSGVVVIDLDGDQGIRQWDRLCVKIGGHPTTIEAVTGGGGRHLYFARPEHHEIRNSVRRLGPGVDVRSDGGYVLAPPSDHKSGNRYRWARGRAPGQCAALELPYGLLRLLVSGNVAEEERAEARPGETTRYGAAALRRICEELSQTAAGGRNNAANLAGFRVARLVAGGQIAEAEGRAALLEACSACGLGQREARLTLRSAWRAGRAHPLRPVPRVA